MNKRGESKTLKTKKKSAYPSFWSVLAVVIALFLINTALKHSSGLGKNNSAEKTITEFASQNGFTLDDYPPEIVEMLVLNDETENFVTNYPYKIQNFQPGNIDFSQYKDCTEPPTLMQWDMRWGYMQYNGNVMGLTGSAPTALSMVAVYVLHNMSMTPVHIAEFSIGSNCESRPEKLLSDGARSLGMTVTEVPRNNNRLSQAVKEKGSAVICMMKSHEFSSFIVVKGVDEDGNFLIIDPSNKKRSETHYSFSQLNTGIKRIWKYSTVSEDNP